MLSISLLSMLIAVPLASYQITPSQFNRLTVLTLGFCTVLTLNGYSFTIAGTGIGLFSGYYEVTPLSVGADFLLFTLGAVILCSWASLSSSLLTNAYNVSTPPIGEHSLLILFTILGGSMLVSSSNLVSLFVALELQSFALYVLAGLYKHSESATSASLKYFFLGAFSSAIVLLGTAMIYSDTGMLDFQSLFVLLSMESPESLRLSGVSAGFVLLGLGFLFKVAAAPLHNWAPDVYDGTPTIVTLWLTTMPKISVFTVLLTLSYGLSSNGSWNSLLLTVALVSLVVGTVLGLSQVRIKRLLTYSTISHVGFLLLPLCIGTLESLDAFAFYLLQYSMTNATVFMVLLAMGYANSASSLAITDLELNRTLTGQFHRTPFLALSIAVCLFSMAGIPPLLGFFAKLQVLTSTVHMGYYSVALVGILVSVVSAFYYLKLVKLLFFYQTSALPIDESHRAPSPVTTVHSSLIALFTLAIGFYMVHPSLLLNTGKLLALQYYSQ